MKYILAILVALSLTGCGLLRPVVKYEVVVQTKYVPVGIDETFVDKGKPMKKIDVQSSTQKDVALYITDLYDSYTERGIRLDNAKKENDSKLSKIEQQNKDEEARVRKLIEDKKNQK